LFAIIHQNDNPSRRTQERNRPAGNDGLPPELQPAKPPVAQDPP